MCDTFGEIFQGEHNRHYVPRGTSVDCARRKKYLGQISRDGMVEFLKRRLQTTSGLVGIFLLLLTACTSTPLTKDKPLAEDLSSRPRRDLSQDEAAGGHILKKHVGRTDEQLRERLEHERHISAASTYSNREMAELAVGSALQQQQGKVQRWLEREGGHPNLVLDYEADSQHPVGWTLHRGQNQSEPCSHALVVLKWAGPNNFYALTSYPECR